MSLSISLKNRNFSQYSCNINIHRSATTADMLNSQVPAGRGPHGTCKHIPQWWSCYACFYQETRPARKICRPSIKQRIFIMVNVVLYFQSSYKNVLLWQKCSVTSTSADYWAFIEMIIKLYLRHVVTTQSHLVIWYITNPGLTQFYTTGSQFQPKIFLLIQDLSIIATT